MDSSLSSINHINHHYHSIFTSLSTPPNIIHLLHTINSSIIGRSTVFKTPFTHTSKYRILSYYDYTASAKSLTFIERYIQQNIMTTYGNTHSKSSTTGIQTTCYRNEARSILTSNTNSSMEDVIIFTGNGTTNTIHLLISILNLPLRLSLLNNKNKNNGKIIILVSPYEHHSNYLQWKENKDVHVITVNLKDGLFDYNHLEELCSLYTGFINGATSDKDVSKNLLLGSFCGVSNVTGIILDTKRITAIMHKYNGYVFFDMAAGAPYLDLDMNPHNDKSLQIDAMFFSMHKFIGGPEAPGVLILKKHLFSSAIPCVPGGGTVFYVSPETTKYSEVFDEREEGGTPNIIGCIRAGLVMNLKQNISPKLIIARDDFICEYIHNRLGKHPYIHMLGPNSKNIARIPIFSFLVYYPCFNINSANKDGKYLHHQFTSCLLNDLFGIQTRAGCACAGPYTHALFDCDNELSELFLKELSSKREIVRFGFSRFSIGYFMDASEIEFVLRAIEWVATNGWMLLPLYVFDIAKGEWKHKSKNLPLLDQKWLSSISYADGTMTYPDTSSEELTAAEVNKFEYFKIAEEILADALLQYEKAKYVDQSVLFAGSLGKVRWFAIPSQSLEVLQQKETARSILNKDEFPFTYLRERTIEPSIKFKKSIDNELEEKTVTLLQSIINTEIKQKEDRSNRKIIDEDDEDEKDETTMDVEIDTIKATVTNGNVCASCFHSHGDDRAEECLSCPCIHFVAKIPKNPKELEKIKKKLVGSMGSTIKKFRMIKEGDRVLVAVSGGKDSLSLLHALLLLKKRAPINFEVGAATVDPSTPEYNPSPLIEYMKENNVPYFYLKQEIISQAKSCMNDKKASICSFCSRMKRGCLYTCARKEGYNVLAMGQHLDDLAESFLMSAFHNGCLRTMKANYHVAQGDIRVIRPLVCTRERILREYSKAFNLPVINENCPACFQQPKERARMKTLLTAQEVLFPQLFSNLQRAMMPLMQAENSIFEKQNGLGAIEDEDD